MPRLGILGGTFNPPHIGHLVCAQEAVARLELDCVLAMPTGVPPHKRVEDEPGPERRLELCRLAMAAEDRVEVSALEVEREGPSYTVDTLEQLRAQRPHEELVFIAGGDMAASLPRWREPERILQLAQFAVAEREGALREEIHRALATLAGYDRIVFFDMPRIDVSSSLIRSRVAEGLPIRHLVPEPVERYIALHGLYRGAAVAAG